MVHIQWIVITNIGAGSHKFVAVAKRSYIWKHLPSLSYKRTFKTTVLLFQLSLPLLVGGVRRAHNVHREERRGRKRETPPSLVFCIDLHSRVRVLGWAICARLIADWMYTSRSWCSFIREDILLMLQCKLALSLHRIVIVMLSSSTNFCNSGKLRADWRKCFILFPHVLYH